MLRQHTGLRRLLALLAVALLASMLPAMTARAAIAPRTALLVANPVSAPAGASVLLAGANFAAATHTFTPTVTVVFTDANGIKSTLGTATTSSQGGAFNLPFTVPSTAATGPGIIAATDVSGTSATLPFDVRPAATRVGASPNSAVPGATTIITGTGFAVNEPITLTFTQGSTAAILSSAAVTTTNTGTFSTTVTVPGTASGGAAAIQAQDRDSNSSTTAFTVVRAGSPLVVVSPSTTSPSATVTITGANYAANQAISLTLAQGSTTLATIANFATTSASGAFSATTTIPASAQPGTASAIAADHTGNSATASFTVNPPYNTNNGPSSFYFAEGFTGQYSTNKRATFTETLSILNANPFTATTAITYLVEGGSPVVVTRSVGPNSTLRESVNSDVGSDKSVASIVTSPSRIYVERIIRRVGASNATLDANSSLGSTTLSHTFYFAEGYTGISFQEYLTLANPSSQDARVTIMYAPQASSSSGAPVQTIIVPANSRVTRNVRRDAGNLPNKSVGMIVTSDQAIMAERVLYFGDGGGSGKFGSTAKAGIQTLSSQYFFAFGSAGGSGLAQRQGDQSFVTILNPGLSQQTAAVTAQFYDAQGRSLGSTTVHVAPDTRQTINVNAIVHNTSSVYATALTSTSLFVAEKPQYFGGTPNAGAHPGVAPTGTPSSIKSAVFPDLSLTSALNESQQQTVFLYNPTQSPVSVTGTYYSGNGSKVVTYALQPNSIFTVNVNADATGLPAGPLGAIFTVASSGSGDAFVATAIANTSDGRSYTGSQGIIASS